MAPTHLQAFCARIQAVFIIDEGVAHKLEQALVEFTGEYVLCIIKGPCLHHDGIRGTTDVAPIEHAADIPGGTDGNRSFGEPGEHALLVLHVPEKGCSLVCRIQPVEGITGVNIRHGAPVPGKIDARVKPADLHPCETAPAAL